MRLPLSCVTLAVLLALGQGYYACCSEPALHQPQRRLLDRVGAE